MRFWRCSRIKSRDRRYERSGARSIPPYMRPAPGAQQYSTETEAQGKDLADDDAGCKKKMMPALDVPGAGISVIL